MSKRDRIVAIAQDDQCGILMPAEPTGRPEMHPIFLQSPGSSLPHFVKSCTPEQLFAVGYALSFRDALRAVMEQHVMPFTTATSVIVSVSLLIRPGRSNQQLDVEVTAILPGTPRARAEELVIQAHVRSPFSHAVRNSIRVRLHVSD
jgi:organic hydroperoxide reductase OsmC/OhrA